MTVVRLDDGNLFIHSPCDIDQDTKKAIERIDEVEFIVAPGSYHYLYVESAQMAFPTAETFICPGIERKKPEIKFDWFLSDRPDKRWENDFDQVLIRGNKLVWEVAFYHKQTRTLILADLIENMTDNTEGVDWALKFWWKFVFRMWNNPKPAPEYQIGWQDKKVASASLKRILHWDFDRIIISHGDTIEKDARQVALHAWKKLLSFSENA